MKNKMRKIYNKVVIGWNEVTQRYDDLLYEDSFQYGGEVMEAQPSDITDIDGNVYQTVVIGDQLWMVESLKVTHYNDGTPIPTGYSMSEWSNLDDPETGAYTVYNNNPLQDQPADPLNTDIYGNLYNWYAANDDRGICPANDGIYDWHVPTNDEFATLRDYLGGQSVAGGKLKECTEGSCPESEYWNSPNTGATNESGFTSLPGGSRNALGYYINMGSHGYFWSSTEQSQYTSRIWRIYGSSSQMNQTNPTYKTSGNSVRCVVNLSDHGCTNPTAMNYDPSATIDDGTCELNPDTYLINEGGSVTLNAGSTTDAEDCPEGSQGQQGDEWGGVCLDCGYADQWIDYETECLDYTWIIECTDYTGLGCPTLTVGRFSPWTTLTLQHTNGQYASVNDSHVIEITPGFTYYYEGAISVQLSVVLSVTDSEGETIATEEPTLIDVVGNDHPVEIDEAVYSTTSIMEGSLVSYEASALDPDGIDNVVIQHRMTVAESPTCAQIMSEELVGYTTFADQGILGAYKDITSNATPYQSYDWSHATPLLDTECTYQNYIYAYAFGSNYDSGDMAQEPLTVTPSANPQMQANSEVGYTFYPDSDPSNPFIWNESIADNYLFLHFCPVDLYHEPSSGHINFFLTVDAGGSIDPDGDALTYSYQLENPIAPGCQGVYDNLDITITIDPNDNTMAKVCPNSLDMVWCEGPETYMCPPFLVKATGEDTTLDQGTASAQFNARCKPFLSQISPQIVAQDNDAQTDVEIFLGNQTDDCSGLTMSVVSNTNEELIPNGNITTSGGWTYDDEKYSCSSTLVMSPAYAVWGLASITIAFEKAYTWTMQGVDLVFTHSTDPREFGVFWQDATDAPTFTSQFIANSGGSDPPAVNWGTPVEINEDTYVTLQLTAVSIDNPVFIVYNWTSSAPDGSVAFIEIEGSGTALCELADSGNCEYNFSIILETIQDYFSLGEGTTIAVQVSDEGVSTEGTILVKVLPVNDPPVINIVVGTSSS